MKNYLILTIVILSFFSSCIKPVEKEYSTIKLEVIADRADFDIEYINEFGVIVNHFKHPDSLFSYTFSAPEGTYLYLKTHAHYGCTTFRSKIYINNEIADSITIRELWNDVIVTATVP